MKATLHEVMRIMYPDEPCIVHLTLTKEDIEMAKQAIENLNSLVDFWGCSDYEEAIIAWVIPLLNAIVTETEKEVP